MKKLNITIATMSLALLLASCASKKAVVDNMPKAQTTTKTPSTSQTASTRATDKQSQVTDVAATQAAMFLKKVVDNQVYAKNVVGDMTFNIQMGSKDVSVPGSLHMRRDEVIRLQLFIPLLGTEVGRLEFTPGRVLLVDRMHKEYIEADYNQLDFLKNNGLNFYSLQALFWNELLVPGQKGVVEADFPKFNVDGSSVKLTNGNMTYNWTTSNNGQIVMTNVNYATAKSGASSNKQLKTVKVDIDMDEVKDKSDWDAKTVVSNKYKKVEATDILGKLMRF